MFQCRTRKAHVTTSRIDQRTNRINRVRRRNPIKRDLSSQVSQGPATRVEANTLDTVASSVQPCAGPATSEDTSNACAVHPRQSAPSISLLTKRQRSSTYKSRLTTCIIQWFSKTEQRISSWIQEVQLRSCRSEISNYWESRSLPSSHQPQQSRAFLDTHFLSLGKFNSWLNPYRVLRFFSTLS